MKSSIHFFALVSGFTLVLAACSSSTTPSTGGASGAAGTGTAGTGTAGTGTAGTGTAGTGTAGTGTAGTGTAGTGTAGTGTAGTGAAGSAGTAGGGPACAAPSAPLISDFSGTGGLISGAPFKGGDPGGTMAPTATTTSGALEITLNGGATTTQYPYAFVGLGFDACVDASAYTGISFTISGTISTGCTIQFSVVDKEHATAASGGICGSCYPGGALFTLPATATPMTMNFADQPDGMTDVTGAASVDPTQILSIQWQVNPPAAGCTGTVTIDDVKFQ